MKSGSHRSIAALTALLAAVCLQTAASAAPQAGKGNLAQATKKLLLVFPTDVVAANVPGADQASDLITGVLADRAIISGLYSVTRFYKTLPTVSRLHDDQQLTDADVSSPFNEDARKATKIAKLSGYDLVLISSVDDYEYDADGKVATVHLSASIVDAQTGRTVGAGLVAKPGTSAKGGAGKEEDRAVEAARAAADNVSKDLLPLNSITSTQATTAQKPEKAPGKKKRSMDWLWGLVAIGVGLGIGRSSGGGGGGGGIESPPAPPSH